MLTLIFCIVAVFILTWVFLSSNLFHKTDLRDITDPPSVDAESLNPSDEEKEKASQRHIEKRIAKLFKKVM